MIMTQKQKQQQQYNSHQSS